MFERVEEKKMLEQFTWRKAEVEGQVNVSQDLEAVLMKETTGISELGEQTILHFIQTLTTHEDLNPKTLKEYASDLKHFIGWFETADHQEEDVVFRIEDWLPQL